MKLTVALTVHDESCVSGPTMTSVEDAISAAQAQGVEVERLIGLDRPTQEAERYFNQAAFDDWTRLVLDVGDLGHARNALAQAATGDAIAFLDADDLFSENWLAEACAILSERDVILHPEVNWIFDAAGEVLWNPSQDSPLYSPYNWRVGNYWDSLAIAPRRAFLEVPYRARDRERGLGFEDWCWNVETLEAGWAHDTVRDTIIFKRRRDSSLVLELRSKKTVVWELEALAIDKIATLGKIAKK